MALIMSIQVGCEVARRSRGLGMNVIAYDPYASAEKALARGVILLNILNTLTYRTSC